MKLDKNIAVIFYDGKCVLCDGFVEFCLKRNKGDFRFCSLQSDYAKRELDESLWKDVSSIIVLKDGKILNKSEAVFLIFEMLDFSPWFLKLFRLVPKTIRDFVYDIVAKYRYRLFGKREESCRLVTLSEKRFFLD